MKNKQLRFTMIIVLISMNFFVGCQNIAAERLAEDCWDLRIPLILENSNFTDNEKELFLIEVMQAKGFTDDEIVDEIEKSSESSNKEE